ncbi:hypothetical protein NE619_08260 [Anaerovorax odorimutans]|uniref:Uncharacterized protein n=2 Tax=Anaerovorax odorimutans TaxID=109327 RepID=A0ABT1RNG6_9FIRM|nr:hypothetical protein [Anaerovorax odorimutans]
MKIAIYLLSRFLYAPIPAAQPAVLVTRPLLATKQPFREQWSRDLPVKSESGRKPAVVYLTLGFLI